MVFAFGEYRLDRDRRELRRGAEVIELEPQVFDLLAYLVQERHRVVGKDELWQAVWGGRIVSDSALTVRVHAARRALGDDGAAQRLIRTFTRKGVRFVGEVREIAPAPALCDAASIAVAPFAAPRGHQPLARFARALAEETTLALWRIRWLQVVSAGPAQKARYRLHASVRQNGGRVRVLARLTEADSGVHLWCERFEGPLEDPPGAQIRVASGIAGAIEPVLLSFEAARALRLPAGDLHPYHAYLRAHAMRSAAARHVPAALALLEKAIARDPDYGPALGLAANCHMRLCMDGSSKDPAADAGKGAEYAWRALEAAPDDPDVLANVAQPLAYAGEDIRRALGLMDRALALNPSFARGWYMRGILNCWAGELELAIEEIETARRLSPRGRFGTAWTAIGNALVFGERFEEAIEALQLAVLEDPSFAPNHRMLAICHAHLGRLDRARAAIARLPAATPLVLPNLARSYRAMARVPEHRELALAGLRRAAGARPEK